LVDDELLRAIRSLRKAIKLTLQEPENPEYRQFTDRLLEIYRRACRVQLDGRLSVAGRARKVAGLDDEILELCAPLWVLELPPLEDGPENDYRVLVNEVMRLMLAKQLFTFVTAEPAVQPNGVSHPVAGTNNEAERTLRGAAAARKTGRTSKTLVGARRQTIRVSVLDHCVSTCRSSRSPASWKRSTVGGRQATVALPSSCKR
jgi:hypothetical protein